MELKNISKWIVATGTLIIWFIKYLFRPLHLVDDTGTFFLGIAPNLIGSFLIPFGAYWLFSGRSFFVARVFRIRSSYDLQQVCLLGLCMLIVNEYLQRIPLFGRTFDYNDIIFSAAGLLTAYFVFGRIQQRTMTQAA